MASKEIKINALEAKKKERAEELARKSAQLDEMNQIKAEAERKAAKSGPTKNPEPKTPETTGIPIVLTRDMKQQLFDLGYSKEEVSVMPYKDVENILTNFITKKKSPSISKSEPKEPEEKKDLDTLKKEFEQEKVRIANLKMARNSNVDETLKNKLEKQIKEIEEPIKAELKKLQKELDEEKVKIANQELVSGRVGQIDQTKKIELEKQIEKLKNSTKKEPTEKPKEVEKETTIAESSKTEEKKVKSLREKIFGFFRRKENPTEEIEELRDQHLLEVEEKRKNELETGPLSARIKNGVLKGINAWEKFGVEEKDKEGKITKEGSFYKRMIKMTVNMALISLISMGAVEKIGQRGMFTATALATTTFAKRMGTGLLIGASIDKINKAIPPKLKKWIPLAVAGIGAGVAVGMTAGLAAPGLALGSSFLGFAATKFKGVYTEEKILKKENDAKNAFQKKLLNKDGKIDTNRISEIEKEYSKILKKYENMRIWGKLLNEGTKILTGSTIAFGALEVSGAITDHNTQATLEAQHKAEENAENRKEYENQPRENYEKLIAQQKEMDESIAKIRHQEIESSIVQKGEGVENPLIRQIEHNHSLAKDLGYKGDINDTKALHEFAGREAHILAKENGYVDDNGNEIRIKNAGEVGYMIKTENGHHSINEIDTNGKTLETHNAGDKFETNPDKYEYTHKHENQQTHEMNIKTTIAPEDPIKNVNVDGLKHEDNPAVTQDQNLMDLRDEDKPFVADDKNATVIPDKNETIKTEEPIKDIKDVPATKEPAAPEQKVYNPKEDLGNKNNENTEKPTVEMPINETGLKHFEFKEPFHTITIQESILSPEAKLEFLYDSNGNIINTELHGNLPIENNPYEITSETAKLSGFDKLEATEKIYEMTSKINFLEKIPANTFEHRFLVQDIIHMKNSILEDYGKIINVDKLDKIKL